VHTTEHRHDSRVNQTNSKVIWKQAKLHFVFICQMAAAICNCTFRLGNRTQISPYLWIRDPIQHNESLDPTGVPAKWHLNPMNGFSSARTCDRKTDHTTKKCVEISNPIVCIAKEQFCLFPKIQPFLLPVIQPTINKKSELMLMRRAIAYGSSCWQLISVNLHPFCRTSLFCS